jgi:hypothetical protein
MEWYKRLFPEATSEKDFVPLYAVETNFGTWTIYSTVRAFGPRMEGGVTFFPRWDRKNIDLIYRDLFKAVRAIAQHRIGIFEWDTSQTKVSDYLPDWTCMVSEKVIFNFIDLWIEKNPTASLREMVDHFETERMSLVNRESIGGFLEEMIISGQIKRLPRDWMTPVELQDVVRLAKRYRIPLGT